MPEYSTGAPWTPKVQGVRTKEQWKELLNPKPLEAFFGLIPEQRAFILARVETGSDRSALRELGLRPARAAEWKRDVQFLAVYQAFCDSLEENVIRLIRGRLVMTSTMALDVWEAFLKEKEPSVAKTRQAKLAKDFLVEMRMELVKGKSLDESVVRDMEHYDPDELVKEAMERAS